MKLFNTLSLEISARCNRKCAFCPNAYATRPNERMDVDLFEAALTELGSIGYKGRIELYVYNEPLMDKKWFEECLVKCRLLVPKACLMIATNGDYCTGTKDILRWYSLGLNQLLINCYSPGLYAKRISWIESMPEWVSRTRSVYSQLPPTAHTIQMLDKSSVEQFGKGVFGLVNRAGNVPGFLPSCSTPLKRMCVKPFRILNINWKGEALVCCQDYYGQMAYGNLAECSLVDLWNHPVMDAYRTHLLAKDRSLPMCRNCDCHAGAYPGNVPSPDTPGTLPEALERLYRPKPGKPSKL